MRVIQFPAVLRLKFHGLQGFWVCCGLGMLAWLVAVPLQAREYGLGLLPLAMLLGVAWANTSGPPAVVDEPGARWCRTIALRSGLALYGFQISVADVMALGFSAIAATVLMVAAMLACADLVGRCLGLDARQRMLVGMGSSICGAAAIAAAASSWKGENAQTAAALATAMVFGTLSIPVLYGVSAHLGWDPAQSGVLYGLAIHEMGHVIAAAGLTGGAAIEMAVLTKMMRVALLAPVLLGVMHVFRSQVKADVGGQAATVPWFIYAFAAAVAVRSSGLMPPAVLQVIHALAQAGLCLGLVALGLSTRWCDLKRAGARVWVLGAVLCLSLWVASAALVYGLQLGMGLHGALHPNGV